MKVSACSMSVVAHDFRRLEDLDSLDLSPIKSA